MRGVLRGVCAATALMVGCSDEGPRSVIYAVAIDGAPGGALLSAWVEPGTERRAWIAGGFVGVSPEALSGQPRGRVLRYDRGVLETVCTADAVLWWVHGLRTPTGVTVFASGENGTVLRVRDGRCEALSIGALDRSGAPTFYGLWVRAPDDVTLVGGSSGSGPRGVLVHYDGTHFALQRERLPERARTRTLYKIAEGALGTFVVGEQGTLLERTGAGLFRDVALETPRTEPLFTVACDALVPRCYAVGGMGVGQLLQADEAGWSRSTTLPEGPDLSGVALQDANSVFLVGAYGLTLHTNNRSWLRPDNSGTRAGLHAVSANAALVLAVGGDLSTPTSDQRATLLVRGETASEFILDGVRYRPMGRVRSTLGGAVGGGQ